MLAHKNRMKTGDEYRLTSRKGRRSTGRLMQMSSLETNSGELPRVGFVLNRKVGTAVTRNRIRRRLKALSYHSLELLSPGTLLVIRVFPPAANASFPELEREFSLLLKKVRGVPSEPQAQDSSHV